MTISSYDDIRNALQEAFAAQVRTVGEWHQREASLDGDPSEEPTLEGFLDLTLRQHWCNFRLWHVEDRARRKDAGAELIAECKYAIDKLNQQRNDLIERLDTFLLRALTPLLPAAVESVRPRHNTETMGVAMDRGSILALKMYHMREQTERAGVTADHVAECQRKLIVLAEQRGDLLVSLIDLLEDFAQGGKRPKVYYQFKMYNDPRLNPELYGRKAGA
jgi:hypothetical protein